MVEALKLPSDCRSAYDLAIACHAPWRRPCACCASRSAGDMFGDRFVLAYTAVKEAEYETFAR